VVEATDGRRITKVRLIRPEDVPPQDSNAYEDDPELMPENSRGANHGTVETSGVETAPGSYFRG